MATCTHAFRKASVCSNLDQILAGHAQVEGIPVLKLAAHLLQMVLGRRNEPVQSIGVGN